MAAAKEEAERAAAEAAEAERVAAAKARFEDRRVSVTFTEAHASLGFRVEELPAGVKDRALGLLFNARVLVSQFASHSVLTSTCVRSST